jgi:hypothetical protein
MSVGAEIDEASREGDALPARIRETELRLARLRRALPVILVAVIVMVLTGLVVVAELPFGMG